MPVRRPGESGGRSRIVTCVALVMGSFGARIVGWLARRRVHCWGWVSGLVLRWPFSGQTAGLRPRKQGEPRNCLAGGRASPRQRVAVCLLWLVLTPNASAVQVWQQGMANGQPVFNTGGAPEASEASALMPVRHPQASALGPDALCSSQPTRDISVFVPSAPAQPQHMLVDARLHGPRLHASILDAFGMRGNDWACHRQVEAIPGFPTEQYVVTPCTLEWHTTLLPVDLRPCGGAVALVETRRTLPCGVIACNALRTGEGWYVPSAYITLLPRGDAFQVWPVGRIQTTVLPSADSLPQVTTLDDRFEVSLSLPGGPVLAYHDVSGDNAVVLTDNGLHYVRAPTFADHLSIRTVVFSHFISGPGLASGTTHFARILPPLDNLPAIQFVAVTHAGQDHPAVVDLRALDGGIAVLTMSAGSTPLERIRSAVQRIGEPARACPLESNVRLGRISIIHREQIVDPFAPLYGAPPVPLVVVGRLPHVAQGLSGFQGPLDAMREPDDAAPSTRGESAIPSRAHTVCSAGISLGVVFVHGVLVGWDRPFVGLMSTLCMVSLLCPQAGVVAGVTWTAGPIGEATDLQQAATIQMHQRVAAGFHSRAETEPLQGPAPLTANEDILSYTLQVSGPHTQWTTQIAGSSTYGDVYEALRQLAQPRERGIPVPRQPQALCRCIQLVSPSAHKDVVTIIVDTGTSTDCFDVPRQGAGQAIHAALKLLYPQSQFRLDVLPTQVLRHGDVVVAYRDDTQSFDVGAWAVPDVKVSERWLSHFAEVYVTAADLGFLRLQLPVGTSREGVHAILMSWLGRQRCLGLPLHTVQVSRRSAAVYCLPRRGRSTLTAILTDAEDTSGLVLITTVDGKQAGPLSCSALAHAPSRLGDFWHDALLRSPVCLRSTMLALVHVEHEYREVQLGIDYSRAARFGWHARVDSAPASHDLSHIASQVGEQSSSGVPLRPWRHAATQTAAAHWPVPASPLYSNALPIRTKPTSCIAAPGHFPAGTLYKLDCPHFGVQCQVPCIPDFVLWAVRVGNQVRVACTAEVTWQEVMEVAGFDAWGLPGTMIHGIDHVWLWPGEVQSLAGKCGHVFHDGSDPYLCLISESQPVALSAPERTAAPLPSGANRPHLGLGLLLFGGGQLRSCCGRRA